MYRIDFSYDSNYIRYMLHFRIFFIFVLMFLYPFSSKSAEQEDIPVAKLGERTDAIVCGSKEWQPFRKAVVSYCSKLSKKESSRSQCKEFLLPAFSHCKYREDEDIFSEPSPLSKREMRRFIKFTYELKQGSIMWEIVFTRRKNHWNVESVAAELY